MASGLEAKVHAAKVVQFGSGEYESTIGLRERILRTPLGLSFSQEELSLEKDHVHLALFSPDKEVLACLVLVPLDGQALKMRQVAVDDAKQGSGLGKRLVLASEKWAVENGYSEMRLNARISAIPFYLRLGYRTEGDEFIEVGIPHKKMLKPFP